jgi:hypothetical protein
MLKANAVEVGTAITSTQKLGAIECKLCSRFNKSIIVNLQTQEKGGQN